MDYTLESLIEILRKRLQDEDYNGEVLTHFLNESQNEILGEDKYPFMQRIDECAVGEAGNFILPPNYAGTFYIYASQGDEPRQELKYVSPDEFFKAPKITMAYTIFANQLFYKTRKDPNNQTYNLLHLYLVNPLPMANLTDKTVIPAQFIEALLLGALARAEQLRDNFDFAQIYENKQDQILTNMKLRYGPGNLTAQNTAQLPYFGGYADVRN